MTRNPPTPGSEAFSAVDPAARTLIAGDLRAVFLPGRGMLGASLRYRGEELLGRVEDLEGSIRTGTTCGIPILHPWANRLNGLRYAAAGREVALDPRLRCFTSTATGCRATACRGPTLPGKCATTVPMR